MPGDFDLEKRWRRDNSHWASSRVTKRFRKVSRGRSSTWRPCNSAFNLGSTSLRVLVSEFAILFESGVEATYSGLNRRAGVTGRVAASEVVTGGVTTNGALLDAGKGKVRLTLLGSI